LRMLIATDRRAADGAELRHHIVANTYQRM
jgi:hypothetical protein